MCSKMVLNAMFEISGMLRIDSSIRLGEREPTELKHSLESQ